MANTVKLANQPQGAPAPPPKVVWDGGPNDNFGKQMGEYQMYQTNAGYSPEQIAAMSSPWYSQHSQAVSDAQWQAAHKDDSGMWKDIAEAQHNADPNHAANGIQYAAYVPGWNTSMSMAKKYQDEVERNSGGFNNLRSQALTPGATQWANKERMRQNLLKMDAIDNGAQAVGGRTAAAEDALAAQGGLSSGARERIAEGGQKSYLSMVQGANRDYAKNDLQVGATDEANKLSMLRDVTGQEKQRNDSWMAANQDDIGKSIEETKRLNAYNDEITKQRNAAYAAQQQANATANSGK